ncbi:MAG: hypothetical protein U0270_23930 [Labilithrix sp.]
MKTDTKAVVLSVLTIGGLVTLIACSDPPPPSLGHVGITQVYDNTGKTSITYVYSDVASCTGYEGSVAQGITIGDGLTIAMSFTRTINDPPEKDADAKALLTKPFTFVVTGDAFRIAKAREADRVIIDTVHPGDGQLVISVDGAGGSVAMPVRVVDQSAVPANVFTTSTCVRDSGVSSTDADTTEPEASAPTDGG